MYVKKPSNTIPDRELEYIFLRNDQKNPYSFLKLSRDYTLTGYTCYTYGAPFGIEENDCLQFAESMVLGSPGYSGKKCVMKSKELEYVFGHTRTQNEKIATMLSKHSYSPYINELASPHVGESYIIIRRKDDLTKVQFHAAAVLFEDDTDRITLEANTHWNDPERPDLERPQFFIYSVSDTTKSFHESTKCEYEPALTFVAVSR